MSEAVKELLDLYDEYELEQQDINREHYARKPWQQQKPIYLYDFMGWLRRREQREHGEVI